ncbi:MAG: ATP-grasp domain-containing protein [Nitrolancea sp.]
MHPQQANESKRVLLLVTPSSYRGSAFTSAAERLGIDVVLGVDLPKALASEWNVPFSVDFSRPHVAASEIASFAREKPIDAIIAVDDSGTILAALASDLLGLPSNSPDAAVAARDKHLMRNLLHSEGVPVPGFRAYPATIDDEVLASEVDYPVVVKPTHLSGSRGVIRADSDDELFAALSRTRQVIQLDGQNLSDSTILLEEFVPGFELALEGLLDNGELHVLALFDKPDPLDGPFFEETIYVTPSRLSIDVQQAIAVCTRDAARALGLQQGPVHAELRVNERGPWIIEVAGRSIGGLCSTILEFGTGMALEDLILLQATGASVGGFQRGDDAVGVMMIPIPKGGVLRRIEGLEEAHQVDGVTGVEITARINHPIVPLPEGASYLGFIFAKGESPHEVESSLRLAHERLEFHITPEIKLRSVTR